MCKHCTFVQTSALAEKAARLTRQVFVYLDRFASLQKALGIATGSFYWVIIWPPSILWTNCLARNAGKSAAGLRRRPFVYLGLFAGFQEALGIGRGIAALQLPSSVLQILPVALQAHAGRKYHSTHVCSNEDHIFYPNWLMAALCVAASAASETIWLFKMLD